MKKLIVLLALIFIPLSVYADDSGNIASVKTMLEQKLQIPTDSEFSNNMTDDGFDLNWTCGNNSVYVNLDKNLRVKELNFSYDNIKKSGKRLPKVSKYDAQQTALTLLVGVANDIIGQLDTSNYTSSFDFDSGYTFTYSRKIDGIRYESNYVTVTVDSDIGKVTGFKRNFYDFNYNKAENLLSIDDAKQHFIQNNGLELRYNKKFVDKKAVAYLAYVPVANYYTDAVSGSSRKDPYSISTNGYFDILSMFEKTTGDISSTEELITSAKAIKIAVNNPYMTIDEGYTAKQAKYYKNSNGDYLISIDFINGSGLINVTLNAKTGELVEFNKDNTNDEIQNTGNASLKNVYSYINENLARYKGQLTPPKIYNDGERTAVLFERTVNNIPYKSNGVYFVLNKSGDIVSYSLAWDNIEFPDPSGAITKDEAYRIFFKKAGLELIYYCSDNGTLMPVYAPSKLSTGIIDAVSGDILNYDGTELTEKKHLAYVDLEDHYAKKQAYALADCNIFVSQGDVSLDGFITQKNYILLISELLSNGKPIIDNLGVVTDEQVAVLYNYLVTNGIMEKNEVSPNSYVTRADAVKWLMRTLGYKEIAELPDIYVEHFKDNDEIPPSLLGYVELSRGLGITTGDDGYFKPKERLTNGDSLILVYNYLSRE